MEKSKLQYNEKEIELIKKHFAENEFLLKGLRKLFHGLDITNDEKKLIKETFKDKEVIDVLRRKVYGEISYDSPIGQLNDFWLGAESQIFGAQRDTIFQTIQSKATIKKMFETAFDLLRDPDGEKVDLEFDPKTAIDDLGVRLIARNLYIKSIETALMSIKTIAGQKTETIEETMKRLQKDSAK